MNVWPRPSENLLLRVPRILSRPDAPVDIAVHEAGHAVLAMRYEFPFKHVEASATEGELHLDFKASDTDHSNVYEGKNWTEKISLAAEAASIWMAGSEAELLAANLSLDSHSIIQTRTNCDDLKKARLLLRQVGGTIAGLLWSRLFARHVLTQHWAMVEAIARELRSRGRLLPADVKAIAETIHSPGVRDGSYLPTHPASCG